MNQNEHSIEMLIGSAISQMNKMVDMKKNSIEFCFSFVSLSTFSFLFFPLFIIDFAGFFFSSHSFASMNTMKTQSSSNWKILIRIRKKRKMSKKTNNNHWKRTKEKWQKKMWVKKKTEHIKRQQQQQLKKNEWGKNYAN